VSAGNRPVESGSPVSFYPISGNLGPGPAPASVPPIGNVRPDDPTPVSPVPRSGNSFDFDGAVVSSPAPAGNSLSAPASAAFLPSDSHHASSPHAATVFAPDVGALAAGIDPNALAASDARLEFNVGSTQVAAADVIDPNLEPRADVLAVSSWEPVDSQPVASTSEVAYWFDSAGAGDFLL
jgi:hypothetical protein